MSCPPLKDWPEGATHYTAPIDDSGMFCAVYWRKEGDRFAECWQVKTNGTLNNIKKPLVTIDNQKRMIERPLQAVGGEDTQRFTMKRSTTLRGFDLIEFEDRYGEACKIQKSSLADDDAIWLGVNDAKPQVMARDAASVGVQTEETTGWVPFPIPEKVMLTTHMHLTREQVAALLPVFQLFVDTGEIS